MKIKTITLTNLALDYVVAVIEGLPIVYDPMGFKTGSEAGYWVWDKSPKGRMLKIGRPYNISSKTVGYSPTTNYLQGGPIVEREKLSPVWSKLWEQWSIPNPRDAGLGILGPTHLVTSFRGLAYDRYGAYVEVPDNLFDSVSV